MGENTTNTHEQSNPFDSFRTLLDQSLAISQSFTDHFHIQMNEGLKLTQECLRYGRAWTETLNKTAFELTERAFRTPGN